MSLARFFRYFFYWVYGFRIEATRLGDIPDYLLARNIGFIDYLGFLGQIGHPLLGERGPNDATG
jgi:hypothetical protein